jgi:hypothetical protein
VIPRKGARRLGISVQLLHDREELNRVELVSHLEVGRQQAGEPNEGGSNRFLIASTEATTIPRRWFVIHALDVDTVRIDNIHRTREVCLAEPECRVPPGGSKSLVLTTSTEIELYRDHRLLIVPEAVQLQQQAKADGALPDQGFGGGFPVPNDFATPRVTNAHLDCESSMAFLIRPLDAGQSPLDHLDVVRLLRKALRAVTEAAGSDDFLNLALRTASEIVDLDRVVLMVPQQSTAIPSTATSTQPVLSSLVFEVADLTNELLKNNSSLGDSRGEPGASSGRRIKWVSRGEQPSRTTSQSQRPNVNSTVLNRVFGAEDDTNI